MTIKELYDLALNRCMENMYLLNKHQKAEYLSRIDQVIKKTMTNGNMKLILETVEEGKSLNKLNSRYPTFVFIYTIHTTNLILCLPIKQYDKLLYAEVFNFVTYCLDQLVEIKPHDEFYPMLFGKLYEASISDIHLFLQETDKQEYQRLIRLYYELREEIPMSVMQESIRNLPEN